MCHVPSWITTKDAVLFVTDKDAKAHDIDWKDATGHSAIRILYPNTQGEQGEGLGKHTPENVVAALTTGKMNRIAAAGGLLVTDGKRALLLTQTGNVDVREGATLTAPALTQTGNVNVWRGATLTAPVLAKTGSVYVWTGATLTAPALTKTGDVYVGRGATLTAPALTKTGDVYVGRGATLTAPKLKRRA